MVDFVISTLETTPQSLGGGENGIVTSTGVLYSGNSSALTISGASADLINLGTIVSQTAFAINGTSLSGSTDISNFGTISGTSGGINLSASDAAFIAIQNAGVIEGVDLANAIFINGSSVTSFVSNTGQILATMANALDFQFGGATTVMNAGTISGNIRLGVGADTIRNAGSLLGDVLMGGGNDLYSGATGEILGAMFGGDGNDTLIGGVEAEDFEGDGGNDQLFGGAGDDTLDGGHDNDTLRGGDADDFLYGDLGNDQLYGDHGFDILQGNSGTDSLYGGTGDDSLGGGDDADVLFGGTGDDTLLGDAGDDVLIGGAGADSLDGGAGTRDRAQYTDATSAVRADLQVTAFNSGFALNDSYTGIEHLYGSFHADTLLGDTGGNFIGGDFGADLIDGRLGSDTLAGGLGLDTLIGGAGADAFVFNTAPAAGNADTINDYTIADDTIQLAAAAFAGLAAGALPGTAFTIGAAATLATHRIIYNSANGQLLYDADGSGAGAAVHFATLSTGLAMAAGEFLVI